MKDVNIEQYETHKPLRRIKWRRKTKNILHIDTKNTSKVYLEIDGELYPNPFIIDVASVSMNPYTTFHPYGYEWFSATGPHSCSSNYGYYTACSYLREVELKFKEVSE